MSDGPALTHATVPVVSVRNLEVHIDTPRGAVRAVDSVSFDICAGESVAIVGESGCGKSMLARSLVRVLPPGGSIVGGEIRLHGREITSVSEREVEQIRGREIAMVFQDPMSYLNPLMRVGDQIAEAVSRHDPAADAWKRAIETLQAVRIPEAARVAGAFPHQLSGGMRQRVIIAIAIACNPALLVADEPTTALDVTIQRQIMNLLQGLRSSMRLAFLLITHDLGLVAEYCDRVLVMYAGEIVEKSSVFDVFRAPRHPYTQALLRSTVIDLRGYQVVEGQPPSLIHPPEGCRFHPRCPQAFEPCSTLSPSVAHFESGATARCWLCNRLPTGETSHDFGAPS